MVISGDIEGGDGDTDGDGYCGWGDGFFVYRCLLRTATPVQ